ncbi:hypothetical protein IWZ00DRAFT_518152 [Phyllosticta capitalensis]
MLAFLRPMGSQMREASGVRFSLLFFCWNPSDAFFLVRLFAGTPPSIAPWRTISRSLVVGGGSCARLAHFLPVCLTPILSPSSIPTLSLHLIAQVAHRRPPQSPSDLPTLNLNLTCCHLIYVHLPTAKRHARKSTHHHHQRYVTAHIPSTSRL